MSANGNPATGAQTAVYFVEEAVCNVIPSNPAWKPLRYTGEIPALQREFLQSAELDGNREITAARSGARSAQGNINVELSHLSHVDLFAAALQTSFASRAAIAGSSSTITFAATTKRITDSGGNSLFATAQAGRKLTVTGAAQSANNTTFTIARKVSDDAVEVYETVTDEGEGNSVTFDAPAIMTASVGRTVRTFSVLIQYNDLLAQPAYDIVTGVEFTGFNLNVATNAISTGTFSVIGRTYLANQTLPAGSTFEAATTSRPYTGLDGTITQDGEKLAIVTSITPTLNNSANAEFAIGETGVAYVSYGRANNTFDISAGFTDYNLFQAFIDETQSAITLRMELDNNFLEFVYPRVQLTAGSPNPQGEGTIVLSTSVQALRDPDVGSSVVVNYNA